MRGVRRQDHKVDVMINAKSNKLGSDMTASSSALSLHNCLPSVTINNGQTTLVIAQMSVSWLKDLCGPVID